MTGPLPTDTEARATGDTSDERADGAQRLRIAVLLGSTRPGRKGDQVARWVVEEARYRTGAGYELLDLRDHPLPLFDESRIPALGDYEHVHTRRWAETIRQYDGFVFVTPEYNHSTSAVLKNALDFLKAEWANRAGAFVGYGAVGGARAIEHLRGIVSELQIAHVRAHLTFSMFTDFEDLDRFAPGELHRTTAAVMFDQLEAWAGALKPLRAPSTPR